MAQVISDTPGLQMGLPLDEGLVVAWIPPTSSMGEEYEYRDGKRDFVAICYDGVLLDMLPADRKNVKWWQVREAARQLRVAPIEPLWTGPVEDFAVSCLPQLPRTEPDWQLAMRQYSRGPWILLEEKKNEQLGFQFSQSDATPVRMGVS